MKKLLVVVMLTMSCAMAPTDTSEISSNVISASRIDVDRITNNRESIHLVAENALTKGSSVSSAVEALLSTDSGVEVFSALAACALPPTVILTSGSLQFFGELGLAPNWENRALNTAERQWVSACMLTKVSGISLASAISLRGVRHLKTDKDERDGWMVQEGAFFGNIFSNPIKWFACQGNGHITNPTDGQLSTRVCAEEDPNHPGTTKCGFTFVGQCEDVCSKTKDFFTRCNPSLDREVITVYLM